MKSKEDLEPLLNDKRNPKSSHHTQSFPRCPPRPHPFITSLFHQTIKTSKPTPVNSIHTLSLSLQWPQPQPPQLSLSSTPPPRPPPPPPPPPPPRACSSPPPSARARSRAALASPQRTRCSRRMSQRASQR